MGCPTHVLTMNNSLSSSHSQLSTVRFKNHWLNGYIFSSRQGIRNNQLKSIVCSVYVYTLSESIKVPVICKGRVFPKRLVITCLTVIFRKKLTSMDWLIPAKCGLFPSRSSLVSGRTSFMSIGVPSSCFMYSFRMPTDSFTSIFSLARIHFRWK